MSDKEKQLNGAMRIFQALSAVDEELLARCEDSENAKASVKKIRPFWYYGRVLAACMCFVVLGAVIWNADGLISHKSESTCDTAESACDAAAPETERAMVTEEMPTSDMDAGVMEQNAMDGESESVAEEEMSDEKMSDAEMPDAGGTGGLKNDALEQSDVTSCIVDMRERLTEEEARAVKELGEYIPTRLPAGYVFEEAARIEASDTGETLGIALCWSKGMDSMHIQISKVVPENIEAVEINRPELYDVHLYDIPYADTVPEEYRESFHNPIFAREDFTLGIVEARMKRIADAGDTDTPRGNFAILYDTGILLTFNGRGEAEAIYSMLSTEE